MMAAPAAVSCSGSEAGRRGASWAARGEESGAVADLGRGRPEAWDVEAPWDSHGGCGRDGEREQEGGS
jgi:hypothetical protein